MDEQRISAYLSLIQALLSCPSGEEPQILNQHAELIDEGFVLVCGMVAEQLQGEGRGNEAEFLLNLAQQLIEYLNSTTNLGASATATQPNATPEEYFNFLMAVLQAIIASHNDRKVVYPLLAQHQNKLDLTFAEIVKQWFESELDANNSERNQALAAILNSLAVDMCQFPLGNRANNLEIAIACYQAALRVYTPDAFPEDWAMTQNNLGAAYRNRIRGERGENLEAAIACYQAALRVYTPEAFPEDWATTQNNLGAAYSDRIRGERGENLEAAIACYQEALKVRTRAAFPQNHTETLFNLGLAYRDQSIHDPTQKQTALQNAYTTFAQAIDSVEYLRGEITSGDEAKRKLNEEWNGLYLRMVEVCLELKNDSAAIEYADRSKARNLVELIATRDAYPEGQIPSEVHQRLQYLRQAIDEENRRLAQDPNPDYTHIDELRQEFQAKFPYKPLEFTQIQSLLDEETGILEWYLLGDKFLTFILTPDPPLTPPYQEGEEKQPSLPPLIRGAGGISLWQSTPEDQENLIDWVNEYLTAYYESKEPLETALKAKREATTEAEKQKAEQLLAAAQDIWQNPLSQRLEALAKILHLDEILQSLFEKFPTCKKLILIPHRFLHLFPLHALPIYLPSPSGRRGRG